jgi:hemolysin III
MTSKKNEIPCMQTTGEEIANSITHGVGVILSIMGLVVLLYSAIIKGTTMHIVSISLYGSSLILLYVISTLYHALTNATAKKVFRRLDHISIYLLIAGTYMPLSLVILKGAVGWTIFGLQCGFCFTGISFKAIFGPKYSIVSALFYLFMGWMSIVAIKPIILAISIKGFMWIIAGGCFYTLGILFFAVDTKVAYFHTIWHLFVLAGSICHFIMIFLYVIPQT